MSTVTWSGLDELKVALALMPAALTDEAIPIITDTADRALADMQSEYPEGELTQMLTQAPIAAGPFFGGVRVRNGSGFAWMWDHGTQERHWARGKGTGAEWGKTHPPHTFARVMAQQRRQMYEQLKAMLERAGLVVSGDA
jgi:hypothetical protein